LDNAQKLKDHRVLESEQLKINVIKKCLTRNKNRTPIFKYKIAQLMLN